MRYVIGVSVRYRLVDPDGTVLSEGDAVAGMAAGALVVSPAYGPVLRVVPADIVSVGEPEPYAVRLVLADGPALELRGLGAMRTRLLAELSDARAGDGPRGVGRPEEFAGWVGDSPARLLLYDDALVVLPDSGDAEKVPYAFIRGVTVDGYRLAVQVAGHAPLPVHRLASRTTEFTDLLGARCRAAGGRTAAFLGALLPGLGALRLRTVADTLRDGVAGARSDLDRVDPTVWPALTAAATRPDRVACLRALERLGTPWIGFKQVVSVERPAQGVEPWRDHAVTPDLGDHGAPGSAFGSGLAGVWAAGAVAAGPPGFDGPYQAMGAALAYRVLGVSGAGGQHPVPRADVSRGRLVPAHTDHEALTTAGDAPTVLAFLLCRTSGGRLVYEVLNDDDHATYVYRAADPGAVATLNRALDLVGFRVEPVPPARLLREAYVGRVVHGDGWADALGVLLD